MCCSNSSLAQMLACQVVEISTCESKQTLVVTRPLLLCVSLRTEIHIIYVLTGASYANIHVMMPHTVLTVVLYWSECSSVGSVCTECVGARERIMIWSERGEK